MRCTQTLEVGVYVLGALAPAERDAFERHLGECAICRDEVADLAVLPGLLGRLDLATAEAIARDGEAASAILDGRAAVQSDTTAAPDSGVRLARPEPTERWAGPTAVPDLPMDQADPEPDPKRWAGPTVVSLLDGAQRRRSAERRRRRTYTFASGLVAACLALVVGISVPLFLRNSGPHMTPMVAVGASSPVAAELGFQPIAGGTKVIMHCSYDDSTNPGDKWQFNLVAVLPSGQEQQLGVWAAGTGDDIRLTATTKLRSKDMRHFELRRADGTKLLKLDR
jgi:hypothetical protein